MHQPEAGPARNLEARVNWAGHELKIDLAAGTPVAIPLDPGGPQPAFFAPFPMHSSPLQSGDFIGDVSQGGSCNVSVLTWAPHCHGTHTECVGHILPQRCDVTATIDNHPCLARLVSLTHGQNGKPVPLAQLQESLAGNIDDYGALLIRSLPNSTEKLSRSYDANPDYLVLDSDCLEWLAASQLQHLLLDTPSLDARNNKQLSNHRIWWGLDNDHPGLSTRSITEMIFVPDSLVDGEYWLQIELSPLQADAAPSRPVLYPLSRCDESGVS